MRLFPFPCSLRQHRRQAGSRSSNRFSRRGDGYGRNASIGRKKVALLSGRLLVFGEWSVKPCLPVRRVDLVDRMLCPGGTPSQLYKTALGLIPRQRSYWRVCVTQSYMVFMRREDNNR